MGNIELEIIVVGAGIAGLAAAISLSRAGHNVTVSGLQILEETVMLIVLQILEKSKFKREAGFMITIGPTGCSVLSSLGENLMQNSSNKLYLLTAIPNRVRLCESKAVDYKFCGWFLIF